jgi:hypothetical protein
MYFSALIENLVKTHVVPNEQKKALFVANYLVTEVQATILSTSLLQSPQIIRLLNRFEKSSTKDKHFLIKTIAKSYLTNSNLNQIEQHTFSALEKHYQLDFKQNSVSSKKISSVILMSKLLLGQDIEILPLEAKLTSIAMSEKALQSKFPFSQIESFYPLQPNLDHYIGQLLKAIELFPREFEPDLGIIEEQLEKTNIKPLITKAATELLEQVVKQGKNASEGQIDALADAIYKEIPYRFDKAFARNATSKALSDAMVHLLNRPDKLAQAKHIDSILRLEKNKISSQSFTLLFLGMLTLAIKIVEPLGIEFSALIGIDLSPLELGIIENHAGFFSFLEKRCLDALEYEVTPDTKVISDKIRTLSLVQKSSFFKSLGSFKEKEDLTDLYQELAP